MQFWIYPNFLKPVGWGFTSPLTSEGTEVLTQLCGIAMGLCCDLDNLRSAPTLSFPSGRKTLGQSWKQWRGFSMPDQEGEPPRRSNPEGIPFSCQPLCRALMRNPQRRRYPDMRGTQYRGRDTLFLSQYKLEFLLVFCFFPQTAQAKISMNCNMNFYCVKY